MIYFNKILLCKSKVAILAIILIISLKEHCNLNAIEVV